MLFKSLLLWVLSNYHSLYDKIYDFIKYSTIGTSCQSDSCVANEYRFSNLVMCRIVENVDPRIRIRILMSRSANTDTDQHFYSVGDCQCVVVLKYWQINNKKFKRFNHISRIYLSIPATSVPSEQFFSAAELFMTLIVIDFWETKLPGYSFWSTIYHCLIFIMTFTFFKVPENCIYLTLLILGNTNVMSMLFYLECYKFVLISSTMKNL